jgi:hypothetical protein
MTVAELKKELEYYEDDMEVVFNLDDPSVEVDSWTEDRWGNHEVSIDANLKPTFISVCGGNMRIELGVIKDS